MGFPSSAQAAATGSRLSFEAVFLPYVLTSDGRPLIERVSELQPKGRRAEGGAKSHTSPE